MRKIVLSMFVTLDGVMEAPHEWSFPYWGDDIADFKQKELFESDALLLGRVTYQGFAEAWPSRTDETGYADRINRMPKYVASQTLDKAEWNNSTVIPENLVAEFTRLKQQSGGNILIFGSSQLVQTLIQHDLIDEYRLLVYPLVLGSGKRLFLDGSQAKLKLVESKPYASGVVGLTYRTDHESK